MPGRARPGRRRGRIPYLPGGRHTWEPCRRPRHGNGRFPVRGTGPCGRTGDQGGGQLAGPPGDLAGAARPVRGILGGQLQHKRGYLPRYLARQRRKRALLVSQRHRKRGPGERRRARQALIGHDAQRVQVAG